MSNTETWNALVTHINSGIEYTVNVGGGFYQDAPAQPYLTASDARNAANQAIAGFHRPEDFITSAVPV